MRGGHSLTVAAAVALALGAMAGAAHAEYTGGVVRIGVMSDMSGLYSDIGGQGSVAAARLAVEDFSPDSKGMTVEIVSADHRNKAEVGAQIARQWLDVEGVDAIADVPNSAVALAVQQVVREKNKVFLISGAGASDLTGPQCSPNSVHWTYDTWALANGTGKTIIETGGKTWFFITADYEFGLALERDTAAVVDQYGGKVVGRVRAPLNTPDFSSYLLQAQASTAKIIGLANAGGDLRNAIQQASEVGIVERGQSLVGLLVFLSNVKTLGLQTAQGLILTEAWYWDMSEANRAFARRFAERVKGAYPTMVQAGVYSAVTHYLKAVAALNSDADGRAVVGEMKALPTDDPLFGRGAIRADGRKLHPMYVFQVKKPSESKGPWDFYNLLATIPADQAFRPLAEGNCGLAKSP